MREDRGFDPESRTLPARNIPKGHHTQMLKNKTLAAAVVAIRPKSGKTIGF